MLRRRREEKWGWDFYSFQGITQVQGGGARGGLAPLDNIAQEEEEHMLFSPEPIINN